MSLYYRAEPVARVWGELLPLLEAHYHEVAHYQDIPLCPDRERYEAVEANGMLRLYTARDDAGALVGYAVFFVQTNAHYATSLQAVQDVLFVHPDYRGHRDGARLVAWCDEQLRSEGVQVVYQHVKDTLDWSPLLAALGYERIESIWGRRLD